MLENNVPMMNHDIYEKVWLLLDTFYRGKPIGNIASFPKMQILWTHIP